MSQHCECAMANCTIVTAVAVVATALSETENGERIKRMQTNQHHLIHFIWLLGGFSFLFLFHSLLQNIKLKRQILCRAPFVWATCCFECAWILLMEPSPRRYASSHRKPCTSERERESVEAKVHEYKSKQAIDVHPRHDELVWVAWPHSATPEEDGIMNAAVAGACLCVCRVYAIFIMIFICVLYSA